MKKLTILSPIRAATLLSVLFLASCGDDDSPTAPGGGRLDSRLFGTWESESMGFTYTFKDNGIMVTRLGDEGFDSVWWIENGQLMVAGASVHRYSIRNGELTLTEIGGDFVEEYRADGNPSRLAGTTWVDEDGNELIFSSDGTWSWGHHDDGDLDDFGYWIVDGNTIWTAEDPEGFDYEVSGKTLTLSLDGDRHVFSKQ